MQPAETILRAAQILLYGHDRDVMLLSKLLADVRSLDEAKDIIIALTIICERKFSVNEMNDIITTVLTSLFSLLSNVI